jgi:hypothetical protein
LQYQVVEIGRPGQLFHFFGGEPAGLSGIIAGFSGTADIMRQQPYQDNVRFHFTGRITADEIFNILDSINFSVDGSFFKDLTFTGIVNGFSQFDAAAGRRPFPFKRLIASFYQEYLVAFTDDGMRT